MSKRTILIALLALVCLPLRGFADDIASVSSIAEKLYASLSDDQKKEATLPMDSPERTKEIFPGGKRSGIKIRTLNEEQQKMATSLLTAFTSESGRKKVIEVTEQTKNNPPDDAGFARYYVCYFGDVGPGKTYAWRIAEHHLTLVHVEVEKGEAKSFGPILLGSDPPAIWGEEEDKMIDLYNAMTPEEQKKATHTGKGVASEAFKGSGIKVGELSPSAKTAAVAVIENRLSFFSDPIAKRARSIIDGSGGIDAMQIEFFGPAEKRCADGGKWDFKLGGASFLCDYENTRGHIHMSMKGNLADASAK